MIISTEGGIDGNPASGYHQGHCYTVTLIQSVEYSSNSYLPEMGKRKGKAFNNSKQRGCSKASIRYKQTQSNHMELPDEPWVAPKPVQGVTADQNCINFRLA